MLKYLDGISDEEITALEIPTGIPLVYDLDRDLKPIRRSLLCMCLLCPYDSSPPPRTNPPPPAPPPPPPPPHPLQVPYHRTC